MQLRTTAWLMVAGLGALTVAAAGALIKTTDLLHEVSTLMLEATESIEATQELEASLLLHNRESRLWQTTGVQSHLERRDEARDRVRHWLEKARTHVSTSLERELLLAADEAVQRYFTRRALLERRGIEAGDIDQQIAPDTDEALARLDALTEVNMLQARESHARATELDSAANAFGLTVVGLLASVALASLILFRRLVYRPILLAKKAMQDFRAGRPVTSTAVGASELRELSVVFADVVAQLRRQRENQVRYIAAVAHDLRNPISAICMGTDLTLAEHGTKVAPEVKATLAIVQRQALLLDRMVADLLDTARSEGGQLELRRRVREVTPIVKESCDLFRSYSRQHEVIFEAPDDGLPPADVDGLRIAQVVNNLISNAIKYSPLGGVVKVRVDRTGDGVVITVTDHGLGIADADRELIFEPFRRATATKDSIPGVGLGLFTARKIVLAHGGTLEVVSTLGQGSTFTVHLPVEVAPIRQRTTVSLPSMSAIKSS